MSSASSAYYGPPGGNAGAAWTEPRRHGPREWAERHGWRGAAWRPIELIAMVLGFMVFWPVGLAILGWKMCARNWNRRDFAEYASERWQRATSGFERRARGERWRPFSSGNSAFDEWKAAEIDRLEEERRKLDEAHREFAEYLYNLRQARDREEFERFKAQRNGRPNGYPPQTEPSGSPA